MHQRSMKRIWWLLRGVMVGLAVALPVSADAPNSGEDRQYETFDARDPVISDRFTKLVWRRSVPSAMTFDEAVNHCAEVGTGAMRLPSLKELLTLVDEEPHEKYDGEKIVVRMIDRAAFPSTPAEEFWTSSKSSASKAWTVDFGTGMTSQADINAGDKRRVRCVDFAP